MSVHSLPSECHGRHTHGISAKHSAEKTRPSTLHKRDYRILSGLSFARTEWLLLFAFHAHNHRLQMKNFCSNGLVLGQRRVGSFANGTQGFAQLLECDARSLLLHLGVAMCLKCSVVVASEPVLETLQSPHAVVCFTFCPLQTLPLAVERLLCSGEVIAQRQNVNTPSVEF